MNGPLHRGARSSILACLFSTNQPHVARPSMPSLTAHRRLDGLTFPYRNARRTRSSAGTCFKTYFCGRSVSAHEGPFFVDRPNCLSKSAHGKRALPSNVKGKGRGYESAPANICRRGPTPCVGPRERRNHGKLGKPGGRLYSLRRSECSPESHVAPMISGLPLVARVHWLRRRR